MKAITHRDQIHGDVRFAHGALSSRPASLQILEKLAGVCVASRFSKLSFAGTFTRFASRSIEISTESWRLAVRSRLRSNAESKTP